MSGYQTQQHRLVHQGRSFRLVSYEGHLADAKHQQSEMPPTWYLMRSGKRLVVNPQVGETAPMELDRQVGKWLDAHVFGGALAVQSQQPPSVGAATLAGREEALLVDMRVSEQ